MKEIYLTQGKVAFVDDPDFEFLNQWKWYANFQHSGYYAMRNLPKINGKRKSISMHVQLMNPANGLFVDHIDRDGLNCQRLNLRICTKSQNNANRAKSKSSNSKFLGVVWFKNNEKWGSRIRKDKKYEYLGLYRTQEEAAFAYNEAAKRLHGDFANLNHIQ